MHRSALPMAGPEPACQEDVGYASAPPSVQAVYEAHVEFVWRSARRLGIQPPQLEDVVQEVFMVVQRRLPEFEGRSSLRTWLFAITRRVVRSAQRNKARRPQPAVVEPPELADPHARSPESQLMAAEDVQLLHALLNQLPEDERALFILADLEEMSGPEIAQALELPLRSVYTRIEAARRAFDKLLRRERGRERRRSWA